MFGLWALAGRRERAVRHFFLPQPPTSLRKRDFSAVLLVQACEHRRRYACADQGHVFDEWTRAERCARAVLASAGRTALAYILARFHPIEVHDGSPLTCISLA